MELSAAARERLAVPPTGFVEAYEYCACGLELVFEMNPESFARAAEAFGKALEIDPDYAMAHSGLGQMRAMRFISTTDVADLEAAIAHLTRALELDPDLGDPYLWLTYAYARQNRFDEAIAAGRRAVEIQPRGALAHYFFAVARWLEAGLVGSGADGWGEAVEHIVRSTELAPRNQSAFLVRGDLYLRCGQYPAAHAAALRAAEIERSGDFENARFVGGQAFLATVLLRQGRHDDAWNAFDAAVRDLERTDHVYTPAFTASCRCQQAEILLRRLDYSGALTLVGAARREIDAHRTSLAVGWFRIRLELLAASCFHRLNMTREERRATGVATDLLESRSGYDFSGVWEGGAGALLFDLADHRALARDPGAACATLERAVAAGWRELPRLDTAVGFAGLGPVPELAALRERLLELPRLPEP